MRTKGSFAIELVLWLFFLLPGLIYSLWRVSNRGLICPRCKWEHIVNKKSSKLSVGASLNELSNETINDPLTDDVEHAIQDTVRYLGMKFRVPASVSDRLSSVLTKSVKEGLGLAEVERLIEKIPECTKHEDQANEMALSAMNRIANVSSLKTWTDLGTVKAVKIYSAKDEMVCPACSGWDGKVVRIRDAKVGATHPPFDFCQNVGRNAHCGCRCFGRPEDIAV